MGQRKNWRSERIVLLRENWSTTIFRKSGPYFDKQETKPFPSYVLRGPFATGQPRVLKNGSWAYLKAGRLVAIRTRFLLGNSLPVPPLPVIGPVQSWSRDVTQGEANFQEEQ